MLGEFREKDQKPELFNLHIRGLINLNYCISSFPWVHNKSIYIFHTPWLSVLVLESPQPVDSRVLDGTPWKRPTWNLNTMPALVQNIVHAKPGSIFQRSMPSTVLCGSLPDSRVYLSDSTLFFFPSLYPSARRTSRTLLLRLGRLLYIGDVVLHKPI